MESSIVNSLSRTPQRFYRSTWRRRVLLWSVFWGIAVPSFADADPHSTGARPPTPEQVAWERDHMIVPRQIKLNPLGLERVNAHRLSRGQPQLFLPLASMGEEVEGDPETVSAPHDTPWAAPAALPTSVDNSTLKYFPPIRSQGSIGSCAQWAAMYYCFTYMNALARNLDAKTGGDAYRFSPKFTYNLVNGGVDSGSWQTDGWAIAAKHGAAAWSDWPYDSDFRGWPLTASVWRNALNVRVNTTGNVYNCDTATGLDQVKTLLVNGYVLTFATYINSWQFKNISNDLSTTEDDAFAGIPAGYWVNGTNGGHAMTVVGYNDSVWVDVNGNGIVDSGEKGAFRIANSWGTGWREAGFTWLAYDALKAVSGVAGGPSSGRNAAWWSNRAMWVTAKSAYSPMALAEFTLNHAKRNELRVSLGLSNPAQTSPASLWSTSYLLSNAGGAYAFNGGLSAVDGTFVLDFSDLSPPYDVAKRWYLRVQDTATGNVATVKSFKWVNGADASEVIKSGLPVDLDNTVSDLFIDGTLTHGSTNTPPTLSALTNQTVNEDAALGPLAFTVGDAQTPAASLMVSGTSGNVSLVPPANLVFSGSDANRTLVVTPAHDKNGTAVISLTVTDSGGLVTQSSFTLNVAPVNDAPVALSQNVGTPPNVSVSLLLAGTDVDGDSLSFVAAPPSHGTVSGSAPQVTYTPTAGFVGVDTFTFTASDGLLSSPPAEVTVRVDSVPPTVAVTLPLDGATVGSATRVTAAASDDGPIDRVVFFVDGVAVATTTGLSSSFFWNTADVANGSHSITARAYDLAGNNALSPAVSVTVSNASVSLQVSPSSFDFYGTVGGDPPPASPLSISSAQGGSSVSWTVSVSTPWLSVSPPSGTGDGVVSVGANPAGLAAGAYSGTVSVASLQPGQEQPLLLPVTLTLSNGSDTLPPTVPTGLAAAVAGPGDILLSWTPSTDVGTSGLAGYRLYRDGVDVGHPTVPHFTDHGLTAGADYVYTVMALDNAGNQSNLSEALRVTMSPDVTPAGLVEIYTYPDPAVRGAPPVVRAVLGNVENVEITIFDAGGRVVHSARVEAPNAVVDGKTAFDYTWTGDIPSGTYTAVVHGTTADGPVKAKTRITVVR